MKKFLLLCSILFSGILHAQDTLFLSYPDIAFENIETTVEIGEESSLIPDFLLVNGDTAYVDNSEEGASFFGQFQCRQRVEYKGLQHCFE
jgi:hypothetical protein